MTYGKATKYHCDCHPSPDLDDKDVLQILMRAMAEIEEEREIIVQHDPAFSGVLEKIGSHPHLAEEQGSQSVHLLYATND